MMLIKLFLMLSFLALQPSSSITFNFKLFNKHGKVVNPVNFCDEYKLIDANTQRQSDFCNSQYALNYNEQSNATSLHTNTVYTNIELAFIHKKDTMNVLVINSGYGAIISIDSLVFKPGRYAIECSSRIVNGKTLSNLPVLKLKQIDYENAKADYYNFWLSKYQEALKKHNAGSALERHFLNIQRIYRIPQDDLEHKTAQELIYKMRGL